MPVTTSVLPSSLRAPAAAAAAVDSISTPCERRSSIALRPKSECRKSYTLLAITGPISLVRLNSSIVGGQEGVDRAEPLGQHAGHAIAHVPDREGVEQRARPRPLLASMPCQQVLGRLAAHPLQLQQLVGRQTVKIAVALDELLIDQLIDQLVAQPLDVHRVAAGVVADPLLDLGRALRGSGSGCRRRPRP